MNLRMGDLYYLRGHDYIPEDPNLNPYDDYDDIPPNLTARITTLFLFPLYIAFCLWIVGLIIEMVQGYYDLRAIRESIKASVIYAAVGWIIGVITEIIIFVGSLVESRQNSKRKRGI